MSNLSSLRELKREFWLIINRLRQYRSEWGDLQKVGNSAFAKFTILVPVIGYMIIFNEKFLEYLTISGTFVWNQDDFASMRLFFFYFGLSSIGVGSIVFQFTCPKIIKRYPEVFLYIEREGNSMSSHEVKFSLNFAQDIFEGLNNRSIPMTASIREFGNDIFSRIKEDSDLNNSRHEILRIRWLVANYRFYLARRFVSFSYSFGFILLAIPTIDTFVRVCIAFGERLIS